MCHTVLKTSVPIIFIDVYAGKEVKKMLYGKHCSTNAILTVQLQAASSIVSETKRNQK